jgi:hypothetical protein
MGYIKGSILCFFVGKGIFGNSLLKEHMTLPECFSDEDLTSPPWRRFAPTLMQVAPLSWS